MKIYLKNNYCFQLPEHLGSVRTISQGKGSQLVLGSTKNSILQGTFELNFQEIVTGHVDEVWALATHPQQNQFLSAGYDQHIHLWDTLTHRAVWSSHIGVRIKLQKNLKNNRNLFFHLIVTLIFS